METNHEKFMLEALLESKKSIADGNGPTGCVIVKDGQIVSRGHNEEHSSCDPTAHAEIVTMRRLCADINSKDLNGYTLYSTLQPCGMCSVACLWANISTIVYGASRTVVPEKLFVEEHLNTIDFIADSCHKDIEVIPNILFKKCAELYNKT